MRARRAAGRFFSLALALLLVLGVPAGAAAETAFTMSPQGAVTKEETTVMRGSAWLDTRAYAYPDGARLSMMRLRTVGGGTAAQDLGKLTLDGTVGALHRWDEATKSWYNIQLQTGSYPAGTYHLATPQGSALLVTSQAYLDHSNGMIEHLPDCDGTLNVTATGTGFLFTLRSPALPANVHAEWFLIRSDAQLVDWSRSDSLEKWSIYCFTGENRWCYNGYYYKAPDSYYPYGPNYFHNLPAAYIVGRMMRDEGQPASAYLGLAMLDVMDGLRNSEGYWPSLAGSTWLRDDYGIGPGYFDTRFNIDLAVAMLNAVSRYGIEEWRADLIRFGDYFCGYAERHHFDYQLGDKVGWLVQDYAHKDGGKPTHCSLNHQAAEAVFLYRLAALTGESRFTETAELLTLGIENSAPYWIRQDGDLHYYRLPDGSFGRKDYAYLTYNDLLELQQYVAESRGTPSALINGLLTSKKLWMDANGVTDYNK